MPTKNWDGQNANHNKKSGQNANLWLALRPAGILSGWHFVRTPQATNQEEINWTHSPPPFEISHCKLLLLSFHLSLTYSI